MKRSDMQFVLIPLAIFAAVLVGFATAACDPLPFTPPPTLLTETPRLPHYGIPSVTASPFATATDAQLYILPVTETPSATNTITPTRTITLTHAPPAPTTLVAAQTVWSGTLTPNIESAVRLPVAGAQANDALTGVVMGLVLLLVGVSVWMLGYCECDPVMAALKRVNFNLALKYLTRLHRGRWRFRRW